MGGLKKVMNKKEILKQRRIIMDYVTILFLGIVVLGVGFDISSNLYYLNIDTPSVLATAGHNLNQLVFIPNPRLDFTYNVIIRLSSILFGNTATVHYVVQFVFYSISLVMIYIFVKKCSKNTKVAVFGASVLVWASPVAENLYTIGKKEIYLTFGMVIFIISLYKLCFCDKLDKKIFRHLWPVLYAWGAFFSLTLKETSYILFACLILVVLYCLIFNRFYLKRVFTCVLILGVVMGFIKWYKVTYITQAEYTNYGLSLETIFNNLVFYVKYHCDVMILGMVSLLVNVYLFVKNSRDVQCAYALILNLTGWGYIVGLSLWRWPQSYYIYPCVFFFSMSLSTMVTVWNRIGYGVKIVWLGVIIGGGIYALSYNYCVSSAYKDVSRMYTESIDELNSVIERQDRILLANSTLYEEPAYQLNNILVRYLQNECYVYGVKQNLNEMDISDEILNLYGYTREAYEAEKEKIEFRIGDYIVVYNDYRNFYGPIRAINPMSDTENEKKILDMGMELEVISSNIVMRQYWGLETGKLGLHNMISGYTIYRIIGV